MKHSRITRIMHILTALQAGKSCTVEELSKTFNTSRRTIFRDLKELHKIGIPYHYDTVTGGYQVEPDFYLPPVDLNLQEAMSLLLLAHKCYSQIQLPFKKSALLAAMKIENNLPPKIRKYCSTSIQNVSTKVTAQAPLANSGEFDRIFSLLQDAIIKKRKVNIQYHSLYENEIINTEICPCHLLYNNRAWYILGFSLIHNSVRTFKLNRIKEIAVADKCYVDTGKFDIYEYLGRAWSMIPEGRLYNIKLRFLPKVANNVAEVKWHDTQKVNHNDDGTVTMEFRVDGLNEITWWILGYGDQVQVLEPKALRKKIVEIAEKTAILNKNI